MPRMSMQQQQQQKRQQKQQQQQHTHSHLLNSPPYTTHTRKRTALTCLKINKLKTFTYINRKQKKHMRISLVVSELTKGFFE